MEGIIDSDTDLLSKDDIEEMTDVINSQDMPGPSRKRVYQSRRNSRACDACRSRKTKCDAPAVGVCGPCTSCASASLICKFTESVDGKKKIGPVRRLRMLETTIEELNEKLRVAELKIQSPSTTIANYSPSNRSPRSPTPQQPRKLSSSSSGDSVLSGPTSTFGFMESVQGYMDGLGYDTSLLDARGLGEWGTHPSSPSKAENLQIRDLRALLPTKENGDKLLAIFHQYIVRYAPVMYWPAVRKKFERAYDAPIFADDQPSVTGIFCVLMTINAYASICSDDSEVFEVPNYSSKRGWYFLEFAKNFHDLQRPSHTLFDVEVLVTMAIYLETVALPYPLRLTVEYLAKVCKDLGLHRKLPDGKFKLDPTELEHRSRMFWSVFLLDQKLALQFGTIPIYKSEEVDIDEPGNNDMTDLIRKGSTLAISGTPQSIMLMQSLIAISRFIGPISHLNPQSNNAERQMNHIEQQLDDLENNFPQNILAWQSSGPLDPVLLDAALLVMATRLSLYRFFTDAGLSPGFRARCFIQCLEVAKVTVHLLRRTIKFPGWDKSFQLRQSGLTYQHIFKTSTILLLAATIFPKPIDTSSELRTCVGVLRVAAPAKPFVIQSLNTLDKISEILKQKPVTEWWQTSDLNSATMRSQVIGNMASLPSGVPFFPGGVPVTTAMPAAAPILGPQVTGWQQSPVTISSYDMSFFTRNESPLGPGYKFPNLASSDPATEPNTWLNQVDPSSWALMQNLLQSGEFQ